jgi:hypothetical protein
MAEATVGEKGGGGPFEGVHFRTLGDVGYLITSLTTPAGTVRALERRVLACSPSVSSRVADGRHK